MFIKWFGCPICQEVIAHIGSLLGTLLKLNTIPIIIHQEDDEIAAQYMENSKDLNVKHLFYAKTTKSLQDQIGIASASLFSHIGSIIKSNMLGLMVGEKKRFFRMPHNVINPLSQFGVITIFKDHVKRKIIYSTLHKRVDFGLVLQQEGAFSSISDDYLSKILKYFPSYDFKKDFQRINSKLNLNEKQKDSKLKLSDFLNNDLGRYFLKGFAVSEFSIENLLLYEEVLKFKEMKESSTFNFAEQLKLAKHILSYYLTENSIMQVNIPIQSAHDVENQLKSYEKEKHSKYEDFEEIFDDIILDVQNNCLSDTFSRFKLSKYRKEYETFMNSEEQTINYFV
jgi:hypothetical protein